VAAEKDELVLHGEPLRRRRLHDGPVLPEDRQEDHPRIPSRGEVRHGAPLPWASRGDVEELDHLPPQELLELGQHLPVRRGGALPQDPVRA
jgi:hypothetical protein